MPRSGLLNKSAEVVARRLDAVAGERTYQLGCAGSAAGGSPTDAGRMT